MSFHTMRVLSVLAIAGAFSAPLHAQAPDMPEVISPLRAETDHNGVNVVNGKLSIAVPVLSVPGAPNLRFDRVQNVTPYVKAKVSGGVGDYATASISVHTGTGTSESFQCSDFDCQSVTGTGSTLAGRGAFRFRQAGSGAHWVYDLKHVKTTGNPSSVMYYGSRIEYPSGETITYTYDTATLPDDMWNSTFYRPTRITSNLGFFITISYNGNQLGVDDWGGVAQAAIYASADPATPLGRLTYGANGTITDLGGRVFSCQGCTNSLGTYLETSSGMLQLPGEGSADCAGRVGAQ